MNFRVVRALSSELQKIAEGRLTLRGQQQESGQKLQNAVKPSSWGADANRLAPVGESPRQAKLLAAQGNEVKRKAQYDAGMSEAVQKAHDSQKSRWRPESPMKTVRETAKVRDNMIDGPEGYQVFSGDHRAMGQPNSNTPDHARQPRLVDGRSVPARMRGDAEEQQRQNWAKGALDKATTAANTLTLGAGGLAAKGTLRALGHIAGHVASHEGQHGAQHVAEGGLIGHPGRPESLGGAGPQKPTAPVQVASKPHTDWRGGGGPKPKAWTPEADGARPTQVVSSLGGTRLKPPVPNNVASSQPRYPTDAGSRGYTPAPGVKPVVASTPLAAQTPIAKAQSVPSIRPAGPGQAPTLRPTSPQPAAFKPSQISSQPAPFRTPVQPIVKTSAWYDHSQQAEAGASLASVVSAAYAIKHGIHGFDRKSGLGWGAAIALQTPGLLGAYMRSRKPVE